MNFAFSDEQEMLRQSARDFLKTHSSLERVRRMREDTIGFSPELWRRMAEAGWLAAVFPEAYGGLGLGYVDLICIQEELGAGLTPEPILSTVTLGGNAVLFGCNEARKQDLLPRIGAGELMMTLAAYELEGRYDLSRVETTATATGAGFALSGQKCFVPEADTSDKLVVSARVKAGAAKGDAVTLFLVDAESSGLALSPIRTVDGRRRSQVTLQEVEVPAEAVLGGVGQGLEILEKTIDRAIVALCAEMVGGMQAALDMSVAYSRERVQFGRPIGSFQALKHLAANMYVTLETARSATYYAAMAIDGDQPDARAAVSCAKALCSDGYLQISKAAIQMHGGIGFTEEHDVHLYYKRALAANVTFGDAAFHRDRYARVKGF